MFWNDFNVYLCPPPGDLPQKRLERKCQQLESIVSAVLKVAKDNQVIVEFCAGGVSVFANYVIFLLYSIIKQISLLHETLFCYRGMLDCY